MPDKSDRVIYPQKILTDQDLSQNDILNVRNINNAYKNILIKSKDKVEINSVSDTEEFSNIQVTSSNITLKSNEVSINSDNTNISSSEVIIDTEDSALIKSGNNFVKILSEDNSSTSESAGHISIPNGKLDVDSNDAVRVKALNYIELTTPLVDTTPDTTPYTRIFQGIDENGNEDNPINPIIKASVGSDSYLKLDKNDVEIQSVTDTIGSTTLTTLKSDTETRVESGNNTYSEYYISNITSQSDKIVARGTGLKDIVTIDSDATNGGVFLESDKEIKSKVGSSSIDAKSSEITINSPSNVLQGANTTISSPTTHLNGDNIILGKDQETEDNKTTTTIRSFNTELIGTNTTLSGTNTTISSPITTLNGDNTIIKGTSTTISSPTTSLSGNNTTISSPTTELTGTNTTISSPTTTLSGNNTTISSTNTNLTGTNTTLSGENIVLDNTSDNSSKIEVKGLNDLHITSNDNTSYTETIDDEEVTKYNSLVSANKVEFKRELLTQNIKIYWDNSTNSLVFAKK